MNKFYFILFLLVPASITTAQTITQQKGLTIAVFNLPQGTIKVYLPDDIRQRDVISGTVVAEPEGKNEKQITRNLAELVKYSIGLNGEKFTVGNAAKTFRFTEPAGKPMHGTMDLLDAKGTNPVQQLTIPAKPINEQKPAPAQCVIPGHVITGSPMTIPGPFDGNAATTQCTIGNQPATVLAESPRSCVVAFPANANGMQQTQVQENGQQPCTKNVSGVQLDVSAGKLNLLKGEKTYIDVKISGLQNLPAPAILNLVNITTDVVIMQPSNIIAVPLESDSLSSGTFNRQFDVQSIRSGNFVVNVNLDFQDIMMSPKDPTPDDPKPEDTKNTVPTVGGEKPDEPKIAVMPDISKIPDSITDKNKKSCSRSTVEDNFPNMDGGLAMSKMAVKRTIKRDDFVPLIAEGADFDMFIIKCSVAGKCPNEVSTAKIVPLAGRVRFEWEILGGKGLGQFVKLGCSFTNNEDGQKTEGEQVIFMPPVVQLPVLPDKVRSVTTKIKLSIIDDKETLKDRQVDRYFEIITLRDPENPDEYKIEIKYKNDQNIPGPISRQPGGNCKAIAGPWIKGKGLVTPKIILPDVQDYNKMVLGQWIVLEAENQHETDVLAGINCTTACSPLLPFSKEFEDNVQWNWTEESGKGKFVISHSGRYVIYQAPTTLPAGQTEMKLVFKVTASNVENGIQSTDDKIESNKVSITVYQPGIKMHYPEKDWLPKNFNSVSVTSELQYFQDNKWQPALAHMCRILFFELINVSQERGITMNDPIFNKADNCFDLQFMNSEIEGNFEVFAPVDFTQTNISNCTLKDQFMMLRTVKPLKEFKVDVYSLDFGSYGFLRSFANVNEGVVLIKKGDQELEKEKFHGNPNFMFKYKSFDKGIGTSPPIYTSIPWLKTEVSHPLSVSGPSRVKADVYTDNRINIPVDIDENHIPDEGWTTAQTIRIPDPPKNNVDEDDLPVGNKTKGDGLSAYEEYRGFSELEGKYNVNIRTNPSIKDVFIFNRDNLDISLFKTVTGLQVHEVKAENILPDAVGDDARSINFNFTKGSPTHIVSQRALRLIDAGTHTGLLGIACPDNTCIYPGTVAPPNWIYEIRIYRDAIFGKEKLKGYDPKLKLAQVVAHELCHGINICHHGDGDLNKETDFDMINGVCSGDIDCVMRYDNSGKHNLGKNGDKVIPETIGSKLCISPVGTGYNTTSKKPGYGDAAPGRGNCLNQMQVTGFGIKPIACKQ